MACSLVDVLTRAIAAHTLVVDTDHKQKEIRIPLVSRAVKQWSLFMSNLYSCQYPFLSFVRPLNALFVSHEPTRWLLSDDSLDDHNIIGTLSIVTRFHEYNYSDDNDNDGDDDAGLFPICRWEDEEEEEEGGKERAHT